MRPKVFANQKVLRPVIVFAFSLFCIIAFGNVESAFGKNDGVTSIFSPLSQPAQEIKETSILVLAVRLSSSLLQGCSSTRSFAFATVPEMKRASRRKSMVVTK
jgi:hypothetical protein